VRNGETYIVYLNLFGLIAIARLLYL